MEVQKIVNNFLQNAHKTFVLYFPEYGPFIDGSLHTGTLLVIVVINLKIFSIVRPRKKIIYQFEFQSGEEYFFSKPKQKRKRLFSAREKIVANKENLTAGKWYRCRRNNGKLTFYESS